MKLYQVLILMLVFALMMAGVTACKKHLVQMEFKDNNIFRTNLEHNKTIFAVRRLI